MYGKKITFKSKDYYSGNLFLYTLFGKISFVKKRKKIYAYYYPGILEKINYYKLGKHTYFVEKITDEELSLLKIFGEVSVEDYDFCNEEKLITSNEVMMERIRSKGAVLRSKRKWLKKV